MLKCEGDKTTGIVEISRIESSAARKWILSPEGAQQLDLLGRQSGLAGQQGRDARLS